MKLFEKLSDYLKHINPRIIIFIIVAALIDTACFFLLIEKGGTGSLLAVILGGLLGLATNIFSYLGSERGIGYFLKIPNVWSLKETQRERRIALITFFIVLLGLGIGQYYLAKQRYQQMQENTQTLEIEIDKWVTVVESDEYKSKTQEQQYEEYIKVRPRLRYVYHSGGTPKIVDWLTMVLPIFTSILSFVVGLIFGKGFDKFEKELKSVDIEIDKIKKELDKEIGPFRDEIKKKKETLVEEKQRSIEELNKKNNTLLTDANLMISEVEKTGQFVGLEDAILQKINGNNDLYSNLVNIKLENVLKPRLPDYYEAQIDELYQNLIKIANTIHTSLSGKARYPINLIDHKLKKLDNYNQDLANLAQKNTDFLSN